MAACDLQGKTVVITGATTGIGEATAIEFAKCGAKLAICGRNLDGLTDTKDKCLQKGSIIFANSIAVQDFVFPSVSTYTCCKAAENSMAKLFALTFANKGVRVNTVRIGAVKTSGLSEAIMDNEMIEQFFENFAACTPLNSTLPTPEEIGRVIVFLGSNQSACITGAVLRTDKGLAMAHPAVDWKQF